MGLGLQIIGTVNAHAAREELFPRVIAWLEANARDMLLHANVDSAPPGPETLRIGLFPAAEDLELSWVHDGEIRASCKTSTIGPGYHVYVCRLLRDIGGAVGINWRPPTDDHGDDTGYFHSRDAAALEAEFLAWLRGLAETLVKHAQNGARGFALSMPTELRFAEDAFATTPLGPRSLDWVREVATDPRHGTDLFPWWRANDEAERDRGRALLLMWQDLPWRPPVDDQEIETLRRVDALLAQAAALNPQLELPWAEWSELLSHLGEPREQVSEKSAKPSPAPRIGYRRSIVWNALTGGWSVRAPGSFVGTFDDQGTWSAFDGTDTLWFSSLTVKGPNGELRPASKVLSEGEGDGRAVVLPLPKDMPYRSTLDQRDDGDGPYVMLTVKVAASGSLGVLSVAMPDEGGLERATSIAASLRHSPRK